MHCAVGSGLERGGKKKKSLRDGRKKGMCGGIEKAPKGRELVPLQQRGRVCGEDFGRKAYKG